jgi:hypothetical protein
METVTAMVMAMGEGATARAPAAPISPTPLPVRRRHRQDVVQRRAGAGKRRSQLLEGMLPGRAVDDRPDAQEALAAEARQDRLRRASATLRSHRSRKRIELQCGTDTEGDLAKGRTLIDGLRAGSP